MKSLLLFTALTLSSASFAETSVYDKIDYSSRPNAKQIAKGEYLVKMGDCVACHTTEGGKHFAGGLAIKTPFGTIYSNNITSDKKTGIGNWTNKQFIQAMKHGISPKGEFYFPVFPYPNFSKLSDQDVLAIFAYLQVTPPIHQVNKAPELGIPFKWRPLQFFWRALFFHNRAGEFQPKPEESIVWNRGAYIVEGLGHCGMCHTPINILGAPVNRYAYQGGLVDGYRAPNLSSTHLGDIPIEKILAVFQKNHRIEGGEIVGPMAQANRDSLSWLTPADQTAMAIYLKSIQSQPIPKKTVSANKLGKSTYDAYCAGCHTVGAGGAPKTNDTAQWSQRLSEQGHEGLVSNAIKGYGSMPAKGGCMNCTDIEIKAAIDYILQVSKADKGNHVDEAIPQINTPKLLTLADGQRIYQHTTCHLCHDAGELGAPKVGDQTAWAWRIKQNMDILYRNAINGIRNMPPKGACISCTDDDIIAATKYMVQQSKQSGDYSLW